MKQQGNRHDGRGVGVGDVEFELGCLSDVAQL